MLPSEVFPARGHLGAAIRGRSGTVWTVCTQMRASVRGPHEAVHPTRSLDNPLQLHVAQPSDSRDDRSQTQSYTHVEPAKLKKQTCRQAVSS
jgi:hypothetical protein